MTRLTASIFDHAHPRNFQSPFNLCEFVSACKKSVNSICPDTRLATPIFYRAQPKNFSSTFNLCEFVSTYKKSGYFTDLFRRYGWLENPVI